MKSCKLLSGVWGLPQLTWNSWHCILAVKELLWLMAVIVWIFLIYWKCHSHLNYKRSHCCNSGVMPEIHYTSFPVNAEAGNLLQTCYGETGVVDFGL